jgi:transcriptional repressor NrdR
MDCPGCHYTDTRIIDTRQSDERTVKRRRQCMKCGLRVTTEEHLSVPRKKKETRHGPVLARP